MNLFKKLLRTYAAGLVGIGLYLSGAVEKAHRRIQEDHVLPLYFHNPGRNLFKNIIIWLQKNDFSFISTEELVHIIRGQYEPGGKSVWITFDDGWRDNLLNVIPVIRQYDIPATFFISTYPIQCSGFFWWTAVNRFKKKLPQKFRVDISEIWRLSWPEIEDIIKDLIGNGNTIPREAMTVEEIKGLSRLPQVTIGGHGVHHLITKNCTKNELVAEITESKLSLESWTKKEVKYFAYPKGISSQRDKSILNEQGYELAANTENYLITNKTDLYSVPRFDIFDGASYYEAICRVVGIWEPFTNKYSIRSVKKMIA